MSYIESPTLITNEFFKIKIIHLPTSPQGKPNSVAFNGWVTEFSDNFSSNWNEEQVYGRMDPLATFQNTQRTISLGFDVVSDSYSAGVKNLAKISKLVEFQYPVYNKSSDRSVQNTLKAGPLLGLEWTNLINDSSNGGRLVGYMRGLNYNPDMSQGGFLFYQEDADTNIITIESDPPNQTAAASGGPVNRTVNQTTQVTQSRAYVPKKVSLSLNFTVLHTHLTGWYKDGDNNFVFGNTTANGKFPNSNYVVTTTTIDATSITRADGTTEGSFDLEQNQTNQSLILDSGE